MLNPVRIRGLAALAVLTWGAAWIPRNLRLLQSGVDARGMPFGGDFVAFWAAGRLALDGRAAEAFDHPVFFAAQDAAIQGNHAHFLWNYPPSYQLWMAPLALLDPIPACLLWWGVTIPLYLAALFAVLPRWETVLVGLATSAALLNLAHGQNGFLLTGIFVLGLSALLGGRQVLGGAVLGMLTVKPHYAVLVPFALASARLWPALGAFVASTAAWLLLAIGVLGAHVFTAFVANLALVRSAMAGATFPYGKLVSPHVTALTLGAPPAVAGALQLGIALAAVGTVLWAWRRPSDHAAAVLLAATPLISPYFYDYDLLLWSGAAVFAVRSGLRHGFRVGQAELWIAAALLPVMLQPLWAKSGVQLGGFAVIALWFALLAYRPRAALLE